MLKAAIMLAAGLFAALPPGLAMAQANADARQALRISADESRHVLEEMRGFLVAAEAVLSALAASDMKAAAAAARAAGTRAAGPPPATLPPKLPASFRQLGADTHRRFDQIATDAETVADREAALKQLAQTMKNCVACHAGYRFDIGPAAK